jgi:hypothetical protein
MEMAYSWDDSNDVSADSKAGYSFEDARKSYEEIAVAKNEKKVFYTYKSECLKTDSPYPVVVGIDTTGSMQEWPKTFFEKLPLLYKEADKYLPGCELSFQAINDFYADGEDAALQPAPFGRGPELDQMIGQLLPVGGGGGKNTESYETFAAYNIFMKAPKAVIKPIVIILGDEVPFETIPSQVASQLGLAPEEAASVTAGEVFRKLHAVADVFLIRKPYYGWSKDEPIMDVWKKIAHMPAERILNIQEPRRVVDVIMGILAVITKRWAEFEKELKGRQSPEQVKEVLDALLPLKEKYKPGPKPDGKSVTTGIGSDDTYKTKGLKIDG